MIRNVAQAILPLQDTGEVPPTAPEKVMHGLVNQANVDPELDAARRSRAPRFARPHVRCRRAGFSGCFVLAALLAAPLLTAAAPKSLQILPGDVALSGSRSSQRIVVQATFDNGNQKDVTAEAKLTVADAKIARIEDAVLTPTGDGSTQLSAEVEGVRAAITISATNTGKPIIPSFVNDVEPVLTKAGCNSGACHGAAAGKNGFRSEPARLRSRDRSLAF